MSHTADPFASLAQRIEEAFQDETAQARKRRDDGLAHLKALREGWGKNGQSSTPREDARPAATPSDPLSLKQAMIQAIFTLRTEITRGRVMSFIYERHPHLNGAKEGTVASTFSRVKGSYLEPAGDDSAHFRLTEKAANDEKLVKSEGDK